MVFSSLEFLFLFLPVFITVYHLTPEAYKNFSLLLGSIFFYGFGVAGHPFYVLLLLLSIVVNFAAGKLLDMTSSRPLRRLILIVGLLYDFFWLLLFKYANFILENLGRIPAFSSLTDVSASFQFLLPIGISFYTFQITSYLIDVYRGTVSHETSMINLGAYLCMFPQLIAGPIVNYKDVSEQLKKRGITKENIETGLRTFTIGMGLKVLLANRFGALMRDINTMGFESMPTSLAWLGMFAYSFQIYFDFYGYSLMAIGLGQMMGFDLPDNFHHPYMAKTMTDFWRRWHITLGAWFREYVYIPLGGNRKGILRQVFNMAVVWLLTGFWHGASWNFIMWGGIIFVLMFFEKVFWGRFLEKNSIIGHLYMLFAIPMTWLCFEITDFEQLLIYIRRALPFFGDTGVNVNPEILSQYISLYGVFFLIGAIFITDIPKKFYEKHKDNLLIILALLAIFWGCVYCMYLGMDDPFLYYRF